MEYQIKQVDLANTDELEKVIGLLKRTFGDHADAQKLAATTQIPGKFDSLYLAAVDHDEIVGFNAFISHDLILNGNIINCYQSCWIATCEEHRGKGIFRSLTMEASDLLSKRGAAFIFCFPNENSRPILTEKLGFREIGSLKWQVPNVPIVRDLHLNEPECDVAAMSENVVFQNGKQLVDLKRKIYGDELLVLEHEESHIWGVTRCKQKFGATLKYFEIGGVYVTDACHLKKLFQDLYRTVRNVEYFQLTTSDGSPFNRFFRHLRPAQTNDLIVSDLNLNTRENVAFNFFGGVKDVF